MLLVKFKKINSFAFCSYLNCRDVINQTIKRAGIEVAYSQGFNPHELLYFSPPTSLGVASECEYVTIYTDDCADFKERFNANAPAGLQVVWAKQIEKRPDFYTLIDYAKYTIEVDETKQTPDLSRLNCTIFDEKKQANTDIRGQIYSITFSDNKFECVVECGQKSNLKVANLIKCLKNSFDINIKSICKDDIYKKEEKLFSVDDLF